MKKIILIVGGVIFIALAGRAIWAWQQMKNDEAGGISTETPQVAIPPTKQASINLLKISIQKEELLNVKEMSTDDLFLKDIIFSKNGKNFIVTVYDKSKDISGYLVFRDGKMSKLSVNTMSKLSADTYKSLFFSQQSISDNGEIVFSGRRDDNKSDFFVDKGNGKVESLGTFEGLWDRFISPDGRTVLLAGGGKVLLHDFRTRTVFTYDAEISVSNINLVNNAAAFIADFKTIVFFKDNVFKEVAEFSKEIVTEVGGKKSYGGQLPELVLSDDGSLVAVKVHETASSLGLYFFDGKERKEKRIYGITPEDDYLVTPLVLSPDKQRLATQMRSGFWVFDDKETRVMAGCFSSSYDFIGVGLFYECLSSANKPIELRLETKDKTIVLNKNLETYFINTRSNVNQNGNIIFLFLRAKMIRPKNYFFLTMSNFMI